MRWWQKAFSKDNRYYWCAVGFVLFLAAATRLWRLGAAPPGMSWDEAALGYIGKMVITTRRDEYAHFLPLTFQSFGDYKAPLAMYLTGLFTTLLGLKPWVVRLPFALAGIASVGLMIRLGARNFNHRWLGLLSGWLLLVAPWHLLFSRVAFESGLALFFYLLLLLSWVEISQQKKVDWRWLAVGAVGTLGALYTYHSAKIVIPLALLLMAGFSWYRSRQWWRDNRLTLAAVAIPTGMLALPLAMSVIIGSGAVRAGQTLIFSQGGSLLTNLAAVLHGLLVHLSFQFLVWGQTDTLRHGTSQWGVLTYSQMLLVILGVSYVLGHGLDCLTNASWWQRIWQRREQSATIPACFWVLLVIIGILPAALGFELPHANRAILSLPAFIMLMVTAIDELRHDLKHLIFTSVVGMLILFSGLELANFWRFYQGPYQASASAAWMQGYLPAVQITDRYRQAGKNIKFTDAYGQPAIFFGFGLDIPPNVYRSQLVPQVTFGSIEPNDLNHYDVIVTSPAERIAGVPAYVVERADGYGAFYFYEKP